MSGEPGIEKEDNQKAFADYLDKRKKFQSTVILSMKNYRKEQKKNMQKIDGELIKLQHQPHIMDEYQMKQILNSVDRLRSLKFLTGIYGNLKDNIFKSYEDLENPMGHAISNSNLKLGFAKKQVAQRSLKHEMEDKLNFNEKVMKQFINREQMIDRKQQNKATQYQLTQDEQMNLETQELLAKQADRDIEDMHMAVDEKLSQQIKYKNTIQEEINQTNRAISKQLKQTEALEQEQKNNLFLLQVDLNSKDENQKMQYALMLQNKIDCLQTQKDNSAHTHNLDLIQILENRCNEQNKQILKQEELCRTLCMRFDIPMTMKSFEAQERLRFPQKEEQPAKKQKKKKSKKPEGSTEKAKTDDPLDSNYQSVAQHKKQIQFNEEGEPVEEEGESDDEEEKLRKKLERAQMIKRKKQAKKRQTFMKMLNEKNFNQLSVQEQLNIIMSNKGLSTEDKKMLIKELYKSKRGYLSKEDGNIMLRLIEMNSEDFKKSVESKVKLTSKYNKIQEKQIMGYLPPVKKMEAESKFKEMPKNHLVKQKKLEYHEELDKFLFDWRQKEYLILQNLNLADRCYKIEACKRSIRELRAQLDYYDQERLKKNYMQLKMQEEQERITRKIVLPTTTKSSNFSLRFSSMETTQKSFYGTFMKKTSQTQRYLDNYKEDQPFFQSTMNSSQNPFQQFQNEMQKSKSVRKNTKPQGQQTFQQFYNEDSTNHQSDM